MRDDLVSILKEAEAKGFTQRERHEVSWRYHTAGKEYERLVPQPATTKYNERELDLYQEGLSQHCATKARSYMSRKIDEAQRKE